MVYYPVAMSSDYYRIEKAIRWLEAHVAAQPELKDVAAVIGLSPHHTQRLFRRWAGVSPKRFLQFLTVRNAKSLLDTPFSVLDASHAVGLSGPGRLHDHMVSADGVTPGEYKAGGKDLLIAYGVGDTPFGKALLAQTERGVCHLGFLDRESVKAEVNALRRIWPYAHLYEDDVATRATLQRIFYPRRGTTRPVEVFVGGTNFQLKVWEALLRIPPGCVVTYGELATSVGQPGAARAVGRAVGSNPVAYLIPCHRVIQQRGAIGGYRWGSARKTAMLLREAGRTTSVLSTR